MEAIKKQYIVDENNQRVAVQLDIGTYQKIEELLENYSLVQLMKENEGSEILDLPKAKTYYSRLKKAD